MDDCLSVANGDSDFENTCLNVLFNSDYFWSWGTVRTLKTWFIKWDIKICHSEILTKFISFESKFLSNSFQWSRWWVILMSKSGWIKRRMMWSRVWARWHRQSYWRCSSWSMWCSYWCCVTWWYQSHRYRFIWVINLDVIDHNLRFTNVMFYIWVI